MQRAHIPWIFYARKSNNEYNLKWSKGYIDYVLKHHFYYGVMVWKDTMYPHRYPPLISQTLFEQVQEREKQL